MSLREMVDRKNIYIIIIVASTLSITYLHHWIFQEDPRRIVLNELYYIPLLLGAMMFGLRHASPVEQKPKKEVSICRLILPLILSTLSWTASVFKERS